MKLKVGDKVAVYYICNLVNGTKREVNTVKEVKRDGSLLLEDGFYASEKQCRLLRKKKKKVVKTMERWANVYRDDNNPSSDYLGLLAKNKEGLSRGTNWIAIVKLTGSYEVSE